MTLNTSLLGEFDGKSEPRDSVGKHVTASWLWYNLRSSDIIRFVQGGVLKAFRCADYMKQLFGALIGSALLVAFGVAAVWAIWDWKNTLQDFIFAIAFSFALAAVLVLPAFIVYLIRERSLASAFRKSCEFWAEVFSEILGQV